MTILGVNLDENTQKFIEIIQLPQSDENTAVLANLIQAGLHQLDNGTLEQLPLHCAVMYNHYSLVKLLLENNHKVECRDQFGRTPLHRAASGDNPEMIKLLLSYHADINAECARKETPLYISVVYFKLNNTEVLLANNAKTETKNVNGGTALHSAACKKSTAITQLLLNHQAKLEARDNDGNTPLHWAVLATSFKNLRLLLDYDADLTAQRKDGNTPLKHALTMISTASFKKLLLVIINTLNTAGHFDSLQEDLCNNLLKKPVKEDNNNWQQQLDIVSKNESIDTPEKMVDQIVDYTPEQQCAFIEMLEKQYTNMRKLIKTSSLTAGILLPHIADGLILASHIRIPEEEHFDISLSNIHIIKQSSANWGSR